MLFFVLLFFVVLSFLAGAFIGNKGTIRQIQSGMFYGFSLGCMLIFIMEVYGLLKNL